MEITVTVHGEPDVLPYTKRFQFQDAGDTVFIASCEKIKKALEKQQKININEALLLFSAFVVSSIKEGKGEAMIEEEASSVLSPDQVMIGVPEMLRRLDFEIILEKTFTVSINRPIPVQDFALSSTM